ncbi:MAG: hypothetical protein FJ096_10460 [Deltaproteobacteria bacterium]|nr:hypothetical protein [Deltaproteobacteria bacterium]
MSRRVLAIALLAASFSACTEERLTPVPARDSSARPLGLFARTLAPDPRDEARASLERDARRRALRFEEVVSPGVTFRSTRVSQREIDAGLWSPGELFELGAQLFHQRFRREDGFGAADLPQLGRFQRGQRGGPEAFQCADCHRRGGPAGAGDASDNAYILGDGERPSTALERNPRALVGAGYLELLGREMSEELAAQRTALLDEARRQDKFVRGPLTAKGIAFGHLTVRPNGTVDATEVEGVDADLVVRPFGWKGHTRTLREFIESELATHHGMQSDWYVAHASTDEKGAMPLPDPDGDGVNSEITEGQVTALTAYLAMQEVPTVEPPTLLHEFDDLTDALMPFWIEGATRFRDIGCATCHVPELKVASPRYTLPARESGATLELDLTREGADPRLVPDTDGGVTLRAFTDLKLHDIGGFLAETFPERGRGVSRFLTPPLWGIARSRPYLHDGRAPTLESAIVMHGGEAQAARDAYEALTDRQRGTIRVFLTALTRGRRFAVP